MLTVETTIPAVHTYPICETIEEALWFDIETTGLSPATSYLYLIGCAHIKEDNLYLIQWFSEDIKEEEFLLKNFLSYLQTFKTLVHYNGNGFDLPYLSKKYAAHSFPYDFGEAVSIDIYKILLPYKKFLPLPSLKQKQVEDFLGIKREDPFNGEELISVYTDYLARSRYERLKNIKSGSGKEYQVSNTSGLPGIPKETSKTMLKALLLHNKEDIIGLYHSSNMMAYVDLFHGNARCISFLPPETAEKYSQLLFCYELAVPIPIPIKISYPYMQSEISLTAKEQHIQITVPMVQCEMKFYFKNYKDYYYLPAEDISIHKSVAQFVEKDFKEKAKAVNCYTKKEGVFLPQWDKLFSPAFRKEYKDKISYFEYELLLQGKHTFREEMLLLYSEHLLRHISNNPACKLV